MTIENTISIAGLFILLLGGYVKLVTKIEKQDIRLANVEKQDDRIMTKLDTIADDISEIKIELQNKQNRP
jgi:peptidoglycan hydrolase CwlO-like protein